MKIKDIIDLHAGKTAFVVANGPSTQKVLNKLKECSQQKDKYVVFVCNEIDMMLNNIKIDLVDDINPDYWVISNPILSVKNYHNSFNLLNKNNGKLIYAESLDFTPNPESLLEIEYLPYDQRHFDYKNCVPFGQCCHPVTGNCSPTTRQRLTVQEELRDYTGFDKRYGSGSTVALHMLAFSILMGCKKIYLSGIDLDYGLGYLDNKSTNCDSFMLRDIIQDFNIIQHSALCKNVEIINLSETSPLKNIFKTIKEVNL
jgi:hypothetical protein